MVAGLRRLDENLLFLCCGGAVFVLHTASSAISFSPDCGRSAWPGKAKWVR